jgi:GTPase SAR1 family protein
MAAHIVTAAGHLSWALPLAKEALKDPDRISSAWDRVTGALLGKKRTIAFTGMQGVGKTVLLDHLTGRAYQQGYKPPNRSRKVETGKLNKNHRRLRLSVVPGQVDSVRLHATDSLFRRNKAVHGVVHVVANGFAVLRQAAAQEALVTRAHITTVEEFRTHQLREELQDLDITCELIRDAIRKTNRPAWMLVAVDKVDLYYDSIGNAERYYARTSESPFTARLHELQEQVGTDRFSWESVPVCAWLENFTWNGSVVESKLKPFERDHYLAGFTETLGEFCAAEE